jgi:flagellar basal-body rod modification protein FlgD
MEIQRASSGGTTAAAPASGKSEVSQEMFLKLLIAQLQHQDPLNPMNSQEFTAQLATFNMLEQLVQMNRRLEAMGAGQSLAADLGATALIGREVVAGGNQVALQEGEAPIHFTLGGEAAQTTIRIRDSRGVVVRSIAAGAQPAGERTVVWDGRADDGRPLPAGSYTFEVEAVAPGGRRVEAETLVRGRVSGVTLGEGGPRLSVGGVEIALAAVRSVR